MSVYLARPTDHTILLRYSMRPARKRTQNASRVKKGGSFTLTRNQPHRQVSARTDFLEDRIYETLTRTLTLPLNVRWRVAHQAQLQSRVRRQPKCAVKTSDKQAETISLLLWGSLAGSQRDKARNLSNAVLKGRRLTFRGPHATSSLSHPKRDFEGDLVCATRPILNL